MSDAFRLEVDGRELDVVDSGGSLLDVLRDQLGLRTVKDGCAPQGQCGCCTVLVDGQPRVACVTPARRVAGRHITTVAGLDDDVRERWAACLLAAGGSQCGFCTPGIVVRLSAVTALNDPAVVDRALLAHLCRCTGWQTIREAAALVAAGGPMPPARHLEAAALRATIEGRAPQRVGLDVVLGDGGFADDIAPAGALVALRAGDGSWAVAPDVAAARVAAGRVQGRRTTLAVT